MTLSSLHSPDVGSRQRSRPGLRGRPKIRAAKADTASLTATPAGAEDPDRHGPLRRHLVDDLDPDGGATETTRPSVANTIRPMPAPVAAM